MPQTEIQENAEHEVLSFCGLGAGCVLQGVVVPAKARGP